MSYSKPPLRSRWTVVIAWVALCATGCFVDRSAIDPQLDAGGGIDAGARADADVIEPDGGEPDGGAPDGGEHDGGERDACIGVLEACNGDDDDCDGVIDDDVTEECSTACGDGLRTCAGGSFGACSAPEPAAETCNNLDDDCDDVIDDGLSRECTTTCGSGTETCSAGAWIGCDAPVPATETCNNVDDDCNGGIDDGLTQACMTACGSGTETCSAGAWVGCDAQAPVAETCNGMDDDCNGMTDELLPRACTNACGTAGTETCSAGAWGACVAPISTEVCNGLDDDCDGTIDNGVCTGCEVRSRAGSTYLFCETQQEWWNARDACRAVGYELATIESTTENTWVGTTALGIADSDWWIGLSDRDDDGAFVWASGSTSSHRSWSGGEPDGGGCVALVNGSNGGEDRGAWIDAGCDNNVRYVCEVP